MKWIKRLFCSHEYEFVTTESWYRSKGHGFICNKCKKPFVAYEADNDFFAKWDDKLRIKSLKYKCEYGYYKTRS